MSTWSSRHKLVHIHNLCRMNGDGHFTFTCPVFGIRSGATTLQTQIAEWKYGRMEEWQNSMAFALRATNSAVLICSSSTAVQYKQPTFMATQCNSQIYICSIVTNQNCRVLKIINCSKKQSAALSVQWPHNPLHQACVWREMAISIQMNTSYTEHILYILTSTSHTCTCTMTQAKIKVTTATL